jgi:hypothetical protein
VDFQTRMDARMSLVGMSDFKCDAQNELVLCQGQKFGLA